MPSELIHLGNSCFFPFFAICLSAGKSLHVMLGVIVKLGDSFNKELEILMLLHKKKKLNKKAEL